MGDIVNFNADEGKPTGYNYFAKGVLDVLCEEEPNEKDLHIDVVDKRGKLHDIIGASLDRESNYVTLEID